MTWLRPALRTCLTLAIWLPTAAAIAEEAGTQGAYLTRIANCAGCHTPPGGEPFAGGRAIQSAYGTFYAPNISPDPDTGIGAWSREQFRRALQQGERPDGSALYPACPYPSYTKVRSEDIDAIFDHLQSQPAVRNETPAHQLRFPYALRSLLPVWQALFFRPGAFASDDARGPEWNRGAYLVEGLGHCSACHQERDAFGATRRDPHAPGQRVRGWYAPSLHASDEAGLQGWSNEAAARLLRAGKSGDASMMGPMADVVFDSLQHLSPEDARAMATYLRALPDRQTEPSIHLFELSAAERQHAMQQGETLYREDCADCHGDAGEGTAAAPALAGNRAVNSPNPTNLARIIRNGGFPPSTQGNPQPFGMPPFPQLSDQELAALITYLRGSWGNQGAPVAAANLP